MFLKSFKTLKWVFCLLPTAKVWNDLGCRLRDFGELLPTADLRLLDYKRLLKGASLDGRR